MDIWKILMYKDLLNKWGEKHIGLERDYGVLTLQKGKFTSLEPESETIANTRKSKACILML